MVSFLRIGIVEQDASGGRYDLGAYALELGLSGLGRLDPVRLSGPILKRCARKSMKQLHWLYGEPMEQPSYASPTPAGLFPSHFAWEPRSLCATQPPGAHLPPSIGRLI
jgi:hypothetical protein